MLRVVFSALLQAADRSDAQTSEVDALKVPKLARNKQASTASPREGFRASGFTAFFGACGLGFGVTGLRVLKCLLSGQPSSEEGA